MWSNPNYPGMKTLHKKQGGRGPPRAQRLNLPLPSGRKAVWWSDLRLSPNIPSPSQESPCSNPPFVCPPSFSRRHSHPLPSPPTPPRLQTPPLKILPSFVPTSVLVWREETMVTATAVASPALSKAERSHLPVILAIAIVARVAMLLVYAHELGFPDLGHWGYEDIYIALSLDSGHGLSSPFGFPSGPTALLAPGYPLLIAGAEEDS